MRFIDIRCTGIAAALLAMALISPAAAGATSDIAGSEMVDAMANKVFSNLYEISDMHWHKGEYCHLININRMILAAKPHDVDTCANTGWILWSMGRDDEAIAVYTAGTKANPHTYYVYDELGSYYYNHKKDWPRAIVNYEIAAKQSDCPNTPTLHMLAHAYERNHQLAKALGVWQRAVKRESDPAAKVNLERVRRAIGANNPKT